METYRLILLQRLSDSIEILSASVLLVGFAKGMWGFLLHELGEMRRKTEASLEGVSNLRPMVGNYILLPLSWLAAIWAIPGEVWQMPVRTEQPAALPLILQSKESGDFVINLRQDSSGTRKQVEIFIKKPLTNPNTTITVEGEGKVLGLLGTRGIWRFDLDSLSAQSKFLKLRFEDKIRGRTLRTVTFK